jgi:hypothetical protein
VTEVDKHSSLLCYGMNHRLQELISLPPFAKNIYFLILKKNLLLLPFLVFAIKAGAYLSGAHYQAIKATLSCHKYTNIIPKRTDTLAYNVIDLIMTEKMQM